MEEIEPNPQHTRTMSKKRILIVDDDVPLTGAMRINLESTGDFEVKVENDSRNTLASARRFRPDVILLDIVMPHLDGGDISAQLEADPILRNIPVLIITALVSSEEAGDRAVVDSGDQVMLPKPIQFDKLVMAIEDRLAGVA